MSYDLRVRSSADPSTPCATNVGFVYIDEPTIAAVKDGLLGTPYGLYWPRMVYGRVVDQLVREGAQTIAFDVLFAERRPDHGGLFRDGQFVESDDVFAEQMRTAGCVLLAADNELMPERLFRTNAAAVGDIRTDKDPDGVLRRVRAYREYDLWHPAFKEVEADPSFGINLSKAQIKPDRVVLPRLEEDAIEVPLNSNGMFSLADFYGDDLPEGAPHEALPITTQRVWHMGIILAARDLGLDLDSAVVDQDAGLITLEGPGVRRVIPVDKEARFLVDWSIQINDPRLQQEPMFNLLQRSMLRQEGDLTNPPQLWSGKMVVVGSIATGNDLQDLGATPIKNTTFLVSKHWNVANSIIMDRFIHRGTALEETGIIFLAGLVAGLFALQLRPIAAFVLTLGGLAGYIVLAFAVYSNNLIWLPVVLPITASVSVYVLVATWRVLFEQGERRRVKSVFSKVVSPNVVSELLGAKELALGGARREITVFFADVRGFTALTDQAQQSVAREVARLGLTGREAKALVDRQAKETLSTVNLYLATVADVVKKHNGTLDKYIGDCVMAFWGAPTPNSQHALYCVRAAIEAQRAIERVNQERARANENPDTPGNELPLLSLGTGINTGEVTVGLMGSDAHILSYTVFGREVNVASRLEGVSGRGRVIISEATYQHLLRDDRELAAGCVALESVSVKGIQEQVKIYEVPWRDQPVTTAAGGGHA